MSITNDKKPEFNFDEMMEKAKAIQEKMRWAQKELESLQITGAAGGGLVQVMMNGQRKVVKIIIDNSVYQEPKEVLTDLVIAAFNDALSKVDSTVQSRIMNIAKDMGLPNDGDSGATQA
ncbi:MAG: YbaB/EbfC family nucleoid-associated protein [Gammaproteobacteria bacterium]